MQDRVVVEKNENIFSFQQKENEGIMVKNTISSTLVFPIYQIGNF